MNTYVATGVMDPTGIRIDWRDKAVPRPDEATVLEFVDELRGIAAHRPDSKVKALVRNMGRDAAYRAGSVTSVTIDHVGAIMCHPADQTAWQEAIADSGAATPSGRPNWVEPELPVPPTPTLRSDTELNGSTTRQRDEGREVSPSTPPPGGPTQNGPEPGVLFAHTFRDAPSSTAAPVSLPEMTVATANTKGGASKTTVAILFTMAASVMAGHNDAILIDINPSGNLGDHTHRTAQCSNVIGLARTSTIASFGANQRDFSTFINWQPEGWATVTSLSSVVERDGELVSDLTGDDIGRIVAKLRHSFALVVFDTGNNAKDAAWQAAIGSAKKILVPLQWDPDTLVQAQAMISDMAAVGHQRLRERVIFVGTYAPGARPDRRRESTYREALATSGWTVMDLPPDRHIAAKGVIEWGALSSRTRRAALSLAEAVLR